MAQEGMSAVIAPQGSSSGTLVTFIFLEADRKLLVLLKIGKYERKDPVFNAAIFVPKDLGNCGSIWFFHLCYYFYI